MSKKRTLDKRELATHLSDEDLLLYFDLVGQAAENNAILSPHFYNGPDNWLWLWRVYLNFFGDVPIIFRTLSGNSMALLLRERGPRNLRVTPRWLARMSRHFYFWVGLVYLMLVGICVSGVICGWVPLLNPWTIAGIALLGGISYIYKQGFKEEVLMQVDLKKILSGIARVLGIRPKGASS